MGVNELEWDLFNGLYVVGFNGLELIAFNGL
jgi:hypothetical protein